MNNRKRIFKKVLVIGCVFFLLTGCETLKRKFTRKRTTKDTQEEMVIVPRDYNAHPYPNDVLYKQYFVYWKSWNQELVTALNDQAPYKKILDCADQALVNLRKMETYLQQEQAKALEVFVKQTEQLKKDIVASENMPPARLISLRYQAERILSNVNRQFDLRKMKEFLKP
ncbi:MAG: hypothetical protein V1863_02850 [Candidatus Omnitrophota bacterium]